MKQGKVYAVFARVNDAWRFEGFMPSETNDDIMKINLTRKRIIDENGHGSFKMLNMDE